MTFHTHEIAPGCKIVASNLRKTSQLMPRGMRTKSFPQLNKQLVVKSSKGKENLEIIYKTGNIY